MVRYVLDDDWAEPDGLTGHVASPGVRRDPVKHPFGRTPRRRSRVLERGGVGGQYFYRPSATDTTKIFRSQGVEVTDDTIGNYHVTRRNNYDAGGMFDSSTTDLVYLSHVGDTYDFGFNPAVPIETYTGAVFPSDEVRQFLAHCDNPKGIAMPARFKNHALGLSPSSLREKGATAIARTIPTAPSVSLAQTLGELRQGLPNLTASATRGGSLSGEYLNVQFGVLPTASDLKEYRETTNKAAETLAQWHRDSGRRVRRRYTFPEERTTAPPVHGQGKTYGTHGGLVWCSSTGQTTVVEKTSQNVWFSGAYRYYVPKGTSDLERELRNLNRLIGFVPTPELAWNLTPFSWLADWTGNTGDTIRNISLLGTDGLVLTYGYIMCHSVTTWEFVWRGNMYHGSAPVPTVITAIVRKDRKQRLGATPYGAGWTGAGLTPKQMSILAALGRSRGR